MAKKKGKKSRRSRVLTACTRNVEKGSFSSIVGCMGGVGRLSGRGHPGRTDDLLFRVRQRGKIKGRSKVGNAEGERLPYLRNFHRMFMKKGEGAGFLRCLRYRKGRERGGWLGQNEVVCHYYFWGTRAVAYRGKGGADCRQRRPAWHVRKKKREGTPFC